MATKRHTAEQIIHLLREVEIHTSEGKTIAQAARQIGVTGQTYYRSRIPPQEKTAGILVEQRLLLPCQV